MMGEYTSKKESFILVFSTFVLLIIFLAIVSFQFHKINRLEERLTVKMVGTFSTTNSADAEYLVFHDDGICGQYRQFGPVEDGTYRSEGSLVTLSFEQGDFHAVYTDGRIYVFAQDKNNVITFSKISNTPTFINTLLR